VLFVKISPSCSGMSRRDDADVSTIHRTGWAGWWSNTSMLSVRSSWGRAGAGASEVEALAPTVPVETAGIEPASAIARR
jgi:hypothetical protein